MNGYRQNSSLSIIFWFIPIFLFCVGMYSTPNGLAQSPDSIGYLLGGNGLLQGLGFKEVSPHFPPLYPMLLGLFGYFFDGDILFGSRVLNGIVGAINGYLIIKIFKPFPLSNLLMSLLVFVVATHYAHIFINLWLWTEPLFLMFLLFNMLLLRAIILDGRYSIQSVIFLGFISGLALLDRYAGIALVVSNIFVVLFCQSKQGLAKKLVSATLVGLVPVLMLLIWVIRNLIYNGTATNRTVEIHFPSLEKIAGGLSVIGNWFVGTVLTRDSSKLLLAGSALLGLIIIIGCAVVAYRFIFMRHLHTEARLITGGLFGCFAVINLSFLITSISFFDAGTPLDRRILSPVFICATVVITYFIHDKTIKIIDRKWLTIFFLCLLLLSMPRSISWIELNRSVGLEHGKTFNDQTKL
jgi:hypothetical protein